MSGKVMLRWNQPLCGTIWFNALFHFYKCCNCFCYTHWMNARARECFFHSSFICCLPPTLLRDQIVCRHNQKHHLNAIADKLWARVPSIRHTSARCACMSKLCFCATVVSVTIFMFSLYCIAMPLLAIRYCRLFSH